MPPRKKVIDVTPDEGEFMTADLYLAAYLISCQRRLRRTERHGARVTFVFGRDAGTLRSSWLDGSGMVSGQTYASTIKNLKSLVSNEG